MDKTPTKTILKALCNTERVLVCCDGHNTPLAPLYNGPDTIISRSACFFKLQTSDRQDNIHVQHLKSFAAQHIPTVTPPKHGRLLVHFNLPADFKATSL